MAAHGGTSVAGSFIQTLTMVDVATGWTECLPLVTREGSLVVEAIKRAQSLFPWIILGADFDNDSAFMNDIVVPWCRAQKIEVTRSRAYKKNDQAFVEQKNGAVARRLMGYGRFDGIETARVMARLYAAARLHVNFFQPSFKLKEKRHEGAKVIKRYHAPATPYERALAHRHAGCTAIETRQILVQRTFVDFNDFWNVSLKSGSVGPALAALDPPEAELLKTRVRQKVPANPAGRLVLRAWANAIKGHLLGRAQE